ncbi:GNAT family protein [Roseateles asaccharophilus]|uniref:RimJ/RimL family protein N-acetyltransferase n=1 Tax=Roseateles asaccharophilus TaxID=582607 RepID=A0ABU2A2W2_9BURK|nr:GNAT family protein [Roseateles asaccharophilus]MDR7330973.1 RimJ/RimL family protein N-acetyltransferase [Roseateles asaccharophilus]
MLRGQRVGLRHVTEQDLPWLKRAVGDPQVFGPFGGTRMMAPHEVDQRWKENGFVSEDVERLLICHLLDGSVIGDVAHFTVARYTTAREIGWTMGDVAMRGQGLATEAAGLLVDYLFGNWPVNRLSCGMSVHNHASRRVAEKCGFKHEGVQRGIVFVDGEYVDCHSLALLRSDWVAARAKA